MARRKLETRDEYRYGPRRILRAGDRFRVAGGPIYITDEGAKIPMYERGVFIFKRHCQRGAEQWIEAYHAGGSGFVILWVGKSCRSRTIPNLRRRPYRITRKLRSHQKKNRTRKREARDQP